MRTALLGLVFLVACGDDAATPPAAAPETTGAAAAAPAVDAAKLAAFQPLPARMDAAGTTATPEQIALGRTLYYDTRFSRNQDISCNSCHQLDKFGVDNQPTSPGHKGQLGGRNSPTTYNAAGHLAQFWDGRAATIEDQAKGPVLNPVEMAMPDEGQVLKVLTSIPGYAPMFAAAFPGEADPITYDNMAKAIGAFERGLVTPSRFDELLAGDATALTDAEKAGLDTFVESGCVSCHSGAYVGGAMYQKLGLVNPWPDTADQGRYDLTKNEADRMMFKVPSLRNITKTGPYFHDGKTATLEEAVKKMAHHQVGKDLTDEQVTSILTFLGALEGTPDAAYIAKPTLPESGPDTPKPDPS
ncbi:MAG: cytochrome-c peroxidase [Myxococcota bacterium]